MNNKIARSKIYALTAVSIGIIISVFIGEMALRVYYFRKYSSKSLTLNQNQKLIYEHKPSIEFINHYGIKVRYNALGFIGDEIGPKKEGVLRILGIGDSVTAGEYLPQEERYLNRLSHILREKNNRPVEVINAGVAGYNSWQELELLKEKGLGVKPDIIIVGVCLNDYTGRKPRLRKIMFDMIAEDIKDNSRARYFDFLYQKSDLYRFIYDFLYKAKSGRLIAGEDMEDNFFDFKPENFEEWEKTLYEMADLAKINRMKILFVIFPLKPQVLKCAGASYDKLSGLFEKEGLYFIDLIKYFCIMGDRDLFLKRDIIHPNAEGHRIAAETIYDYIIKNGIIN